MRSVPQSRERGLDGAHEVDRARARVVGVAADADREDDLVAESAGVQPLPDDVLAAPAGEAVGGVDGVAAALDVGVEDLVARLEVDVPAELGAAEDEREDLGSALAERRRARPARAADPARESGRTGARRTGAANGCGRLAEETAEPTPKIAMSHPLTIDSGWSFRDCVSLHTPRRCTSRVGRSGAGAGHSGIRSVNIG